MGAQEEKPPKIFQNYSTDELFPSNTKTKILTTLKEYKKIDILNFSKRKEEAIKLLKEGNIQKAIEYDNTSYDINLNYSKLIKNDEILNLFDENLNKNNLEQLIKEIINSEQWNEEKIKDKYNEYKNDINKRYKFNQPIDINNTSLYFYNTRIHILFDLLESDNILHFKKKLKKKRNIYNKINIINIIDKNEYPQDKNKLKYLMLILIKVDNEVDANYMINSIFSEKENIKECLEEMKKFVSNISYNEIEKTVYINEIPIKKKFYSFKSILSYLKQKLPFYYFYGDYLYNYEYFLESYWINSIYENLKKLIGVIFKSKIYANILNELFKKSQFEIDFIQSDDFIQFLFSKINFIPISTNQIPFLDKLSLDIFLGGYDNYLINNNNSNYKEMIKYILKIGCNIIYIIHEGGGHFIYSYFTIISNNYYEFGSPKIKINKKWIKSESGEQVELLLFGRVTGTVKLKEILFILNTKNYEIYNNFDEFRNNFMLSNNKEYEDLTKDFKGPFSDLINEIKWNEIEDNRDFPTSISTKNKNDEQPSIIINRSKNDTLGKTFDD